MKRFPTADRIEKFTGCDRETALTIRRLMTGRTSVADVLGDWDPYRPAVEGVMEAIDHLLDTCGVEAIEYPDHGWRHHFWGDIAAVYCNTGDSYGGTVLFDVERQTFYVTTWADWVETAERNRPEFKRED